MSNTVEIRGAEIPLEDLKKILRENKISQAELSGRSGLHQSTVSTQLNGKTAMASELMLAILDVLDENELLVKEDLAFNGSLSKLDLAILRAKEAIKYPFDTIVLDSLSQLMVTPFPMEDAHKLALMVRKEFSNGKIRQNFSMRKLKLWGEAYYLLQSHGFSADDALMGGYHVAAVAKALPKSEDRMFIEGAFDLVFTLGVPQLPLANANRVRSDGNRHPADYIVEALKAGGIPTWLTGESATGKSWSARRVAGSYLRIQGTHDTHEDDFVGAMAAREASTYFQYGPLPLAMQGGKVLIIDEMTFIPSGALASLQAVLEGEPLVIKANGGEVVYPKEGFSVIVTDNTRGLGEGLSYVGTEVVNESIRDRFACVEFDYMRPSQEKEAVESHLGTLLKRHGLNLEDTR